MTVVSKTLPAVNVLVSGLQKKGDSTLKPNLLLWFSDRRETSLNWTAEHKDGCFYLLQSQ